MKGPKKANIAKFPKTSLTVSVDLIVLILFKVPIIQANGIKINEIEVNADYAKIKNIMY